MFFSTFFNIKSKTCRWNNGKQLVICVISHIPRKKLLILTVFTLFLILDKIQDGYHVWCHYRPPAAQPPIKYSSSCREDQRLSTEGKIVSKYCNLSKTQGGFPSTSLCTTLGVWLCGYVRGLRHDPKPKLHKSDKQS